MRKIGQAKQGIVWVQLAIRCGLCLAVCLMAISLSASTARAAFGISSLSTEATNEDGSPDFQAGSHPFSYRFSFAMNTDGEGNPEGGLRGIEVDLPPGLVGDPGAVSDCSRAEFEGSPRCPPSSQVGVVEATVIGLGTIELPLYNLTPPPGYVASFGGSAVGNSFIELLSVVGSGREAHLQVTVPLLPMGNEIVHVDQRLWGVPADPGHNAERGECLSGGGSCPPETSPAAFLTLPVHCGGPPVTTVSVSSVEDPLHPLTVRAGLGIGQQGLLGCESLAFAPTFALGPDGNALSPAGLQVEVGLGASEQRYGWSAAAARESTLHLPPGLAVNPSAGSGLEACTPAQIGLESEPGRPARFDASAPACPGGSKVGTASAELPPLGEPLSGPVYLAGPDQNPYATRFAVYMVLEDPARGLEIKIPARFEADAATGRLTAAITDLPEFPFAKIGLRFPAGPRALFATPPGCGEYVSTADLVPSTAPEGPVSNAQSRFVLSSGPGGPCPPPEVERPVPTSFEAGTLSPSAGSASSLVLRLGRADLDQHFGSFDLTLPPGLVGNLGTLPVGAAVGGVEVKAGLGPQPLSLAGTVYLGGPYRGAPYSLETVVPAQVGPFDLGTIVQRAALEVDPLTAQISVRSDPLPQILDGVPLELRGLALDLDRPGFIRNPTSCEPMAITGTATTSLGQTAPLSDRFQVGDCAALAFKPKASLRFSGSLRRNGHPALRAALRSGSDEASISSAAFNLPPAELLDLQHVRALCAQGTPSGDCPKSSQLGRLRLISPFLDAPAAGSVYLLKPSHRLPELLAEVRSGALRFVLHGRTDLRKGRFGVSFAAIPDIPLSRAVLGFEGGRRGLFVNSRSLCGGAGRAEARLRGHNGKRRRLSIRPQIEGHCHSA